MSLKQELEIYMKAVAAFDAGDYALAIANFEGIRESSKIQFNIGMVYATLGDHKTAINCFKKAVQYDRYLAIAYFQEGISNFTLRRYSEAMQSFNTALLYLRSNHVIDYCQLGLNFKLYSCEILYNRGLCFLQLGDQKKGMLDLELAARHKQSDEHDIITDALRDQGEGYTVLTIPSGIIYRPDETKVRNIAARDYLGKARLIAASDANDTSTGFAGSTRKSSEIRSRRAISATSIDLSHYVLPISSDEADLTATLTQLDTDLDRATSISSNSRSLFPSPKRSRTIVRKISGAGLPPTPPPERSQTPRRKTSTASSASSKYDAPGYYSPSTTSNESLSRSKTLPRLPVPQADDYLSLVDSYTKVRCKLHYDGEVRVMTLTTPISYDSLASRIQRKMNGTYRLYSLDEDGDEIRIADDEDIIDLTHDGKLEIYLR